MYVCFHCAVCSCFSPCNDFLCLCKDHYENKVVKPVLCHPCQYHLVNVNFYFIFHLFFSVSICVAFLLLVECIFSFGKIILLLTGICTPNTHVPQIHKIIFNPNNLVTDALS